jgi:hypothetical protein
MCKLTAAPGALARVQTRASGKPLPTGVFAIARRNNRTQLSFRGVTTELRYERWFLPFSVPLGLGPKQSEVRIEGDMLHVKFGWGFRTEIPLSSINNAEPNTERVYAWGAHGFRGRWLVNGSSKGIVELTIDPPARAYVMGVPITLRTLDVSVTDPDGLIAAVTHKV